MLPFIMHIYFFKGTIKSENYPCDYPPMSNRDYFIEVTAEKVITIKFANFSMETNDCQYDSLTLYDYIDGRYEQVKKLCNHDLPEPYTSKSHKMKLHFTSDGGTQYSGFKLTYAETDVPKTTLPPGA